MKERDSIFDSNSFHMLLNRINGLHVPSTDPSSNASTPHLIFRLFGDLTVLASLLSYMLGLFSSGPSLTDKCVCMSILSSVIMTFLKMTYMAWRRDDFQDYFDVWNASFSKYGADAELVKIRAPEMRRLKLLTGALVLTLAFPPVPSNIMPLFSSSQTENGGRYLLIPAWYPFDPLASPAYEMVAIFRAFSAFLILSRLVAFDTFFFSLASLHVCQLKHLELTLGRMFSESEELAIGDGSAPFGEARSLESVKRASRRRQDDGKVMAQRLRDWVTYHQTVIRMGDKLQSLYSPIFMIEFTLLVLISCFSSFVFVAVQLDGSRKRMFVMYALSNLTQLFLYCNYGDRLETASSALSTTAFGCGWHEKAVMPEIRSSLKMLFQRVQTPLRLSALGLYALSAETFLSIVNTAISYLMVLLEVMS